MQDTVGLSLPTHTLSEASYYSPVQTCYQFSSIMVFSCTGSTFTALSLDYTTNGQLIGTITADTTWNEYTKGKFLYNLGGKKYDATFTLCDSLTSSSVACGYPGNVIVDMSGFAATYLGQDFSSSRMKTLITSAYINFSAKPN